MEIGRNPVGSGHGAISAKLHWRRHILFYCQSCRPTILHLVANIASLRLAFRVTRQERPFTVDAIVILPDHLHTIMTLPVDDADFSGRWRRIKSLFSREVVAGGLPVGRDQRGEYAVWQKRFWEHTIRDETDLERHVDYIHYNPVKHRLVSRVVDWPYSSFHRYVRQGWLPQDWAGIVERTTARFGER